MTRISKYGISLRLVEEEDAGFILFLRKDKSKSRFISKTDCDIEKQKEWIRKYKEREKDEQEYYFIASDSEGEDFATYRVYNIIGGVPEIGSWVSKPNYKNFKNSIRVDIAIKDYVFEELDYDSLRFEVRRKNYSVNKYHKLFNPMLIEANETDNYYILNRNAYTKARKEVLKKIKI